MPPRIPSSDRNSLTPVQMVNRISRLQFSPYLFRISILFYLLTGIQKEIVCGFVLEMSVGLVQIGEMFIETFQEIFSNLLYLPN